MRIETRRAAGVCILNVHGAITLPEEAHLRQAFRDAINGGDRLFLLNLNDSAYLDSLAIGELVACLKRAREAGGMLKLVLPEGGKIHQLLELCVLDRAFELFHDEEEGLGSFVL